MGIKHLIECHCILQIYKNKDPIVYHKFPVYSHIKEDVVVPKYVKCNNCGTVHYVYEICKSEIKIGNEDSLSIRTIEDISLSLPDKINNVLKSHNCSVEVYEQIEDIIENSLYPNVVILKREIINDSQSLKMLEIISENKVKVKNEILELTIVREENE